MSIININLRSKIDDYSPYVNLFKMAPKINGRSHRTLESPSKCLTNHDSGNNLDSRRLDIKILKSLK